MVDRECARHDWCTLGKISKCSEINPSMPDLISLHFVLVLFVLPGVLALRAFTSKVIRIPTIKATIGAARTKGWWSIQPWAILLRSRGGVRRPVAEVARIPNALAEGPSEEL